LVTAAGVIRGRKVSAYPACAAEVKLAGGDYAQIGIDQAVTDGKLTQAQADKIEQRLPTVIDKLVNHHKGDGAGG